MFKVGDRVVVVEDTYAEGYWLQRRGVVSGVDLQANLPIRVSLDEGGCASFKPGELEFEHIYDALSSPAVMVETRLEGESEDSVNHPSHYTSHPSGVECIQVTEWMGFNDGNAVKYIWRAGLKSDDPIQDLHKARWYIEREIQRLGGTVG